MPLKAFSYTKLVVADLDASEAFYCDVMGLKTLMRDTMCETEWAYEECVMSATGEQGAPMLQLIRYSKKPAPAPTGAWIGFMVTEIDALIESVVAAGGCMHMAATRIEKHGVVGAIVSDPEGHMIELIETMSDE